MPKLIQTTTTETETTWKGLANLIKGGGGTLKIGDIITEKTLDGEEMDLVVVDMGPDWARFESKDCLPVEVAYNQNNRNAGGFADSDVKRYLNEEVFNNLPEELRNVIAEVERKQENGESSLCRLFLPTESELFGDCCYSEDDTYSQIEYYKDRRNRIKCNRKGGSPDWYWTASVGRVQLGYLRGRPHLRVLRQLARQPRALRPGLLRNSVNHKSRRLCAAA